MTNLETIKLLLQESPIQHEDGCAFVEFEKDGKYIYCYDHFDGKTFEYSLCNVIDGNYENITLTEAEIQYLKNELWEVFKTETDRIEKEIEAENEIMETIRANHVPDYIEQRF